MPLVFKRPPKPKPEVTSQNLEPEKLPQDPPTSLPTSYGTPDSYVGQWMGTLRHGFGCTTYSVEPQLKMPRTQLGKPKAAAQPDNKTPQSSHTGQYSFDKSRYVRRAYRILETMFSFLYN